MGEKLSNFGYAHFFWMFFVVIDDEGFDPFEVGFFCAGRVAFDAEGVAVLVEKFFPLWGRCTLGRWVLGVHFIASKYERAYNLFYLL